MGERCGTSLILLAYGANKMAFTTDTKVGELLDNPQAKTILDQCMPGFSTNPQVGMARGFSLKTAAGFSGGLITPEMLASVDAALAKLQ
jgi:hypothetical protein